MDCTGGFFISELPDKVANLFTEGRHHVQSMPAFFTKLLASCKLAQIRSHP